MSNMRKYSSRYNTVKINSPEFELKDYLDKKLDNFFPDTGRWYSSCFSKPDFLSIDYLPCHLDDNKWLARMLMKYCNISSGEYKNVLDYVKTSDLFYKKKKEYGLKIVRWQINFIRNGGEGYLLKDKHGVELWRISEDCDKSFRWAVIDTLEAVGMNRNLIEEGLEKFSDDWRIIYINHAFRNKYEPVVYNFLDSERAKEYPKVSEDFKSTWIAMRKYEYYIEHREFVELYGTIEPEMKISSEEYEDLKEYVFSESRKRIDEIESVDLMYFDDSNYENNISTKKRKVFFRKNKSCACKQK